MTFLKKLFHKHKWIYRIGTRTPQQYIEWFDCKCGCCKITSDKGNNIIMEDVHYLKSNNHANTN